MFGFVRQIDMPWDEAQVCIDFYFAICFGIRDYMGRTRKHAHEHGYMETLFGRRIHIPSIRDRNQAVRDHVERAPIKLPSRVPPSTSSAGDGVHTGSALGLKARILLQTCDELVFKVPEVEAERTGQAAARMMREVSLPACQLTVPIVIDADLGPSWNETH